MADTGAAAGGRSSADDVVAEPDYSTTPMSLGWGDWWRAKREKPALEGLVLKSDEPVGRIESTHGTDTRARIEDSRGLPWSAICHLEVDFGGAKGTGTGCLIGPRFVMTAAHVLHPRGGHGRARSIRVMPGRTCEDPVQHVRFSSDYYISPSWNPDANDPRHDYGIIALPDDGFKIFGSFGLKVLNNAALAEFKKRSIVFTVAGYPKDKPRGTLWQGKGTLREFGSEAISYTIDTERGQSGAPVFAYADNNEPVAFAIHVQGFSTHNIARRINGFAAADIGRQIGDKTLVA